MKPSIATLERKLTGLKRKLSEIGDIRPGSLSEQYNVCGSPTCRCKAVPPQKHGPYYKLTSTRKGKSSCRFVKEVERPIIEDQVKNYKFLRALFDEWIDLGSQLADLRLKRQLEKNSTA